MGSLPSIRGGGEGKEDVVPVGFDEGILRGLCDMDVSYDCDLIREIGLKTISVRSHWWQIG